MTISQTNKLAKRKALNMNDLDNNLNNLVKNIKIKQQMELIKKIKDWLIGVQEVNEPNAEWTIDVDSLSDIDKGWLECSQMLLEQIEKWEN